MAIREDRLIEVLASSEQSRKAEKERRRAAMDAVVDLLVERAETRHLLQVLAMGVLNGDPASRGVALDSWAFLDRTA